MRRHIAVQSLVCTAGGDDDPYPLTFRHLDNRTYYMVDRDDGRDLLNYSGCGNTVSANQEVVKRLIIDSLRMCGPDTHYSLKP